VGVNYYQGKLVRDRKPDEYGANENTSVSELDAGVVTSSDPTWIRYNHGKVDFGGGGSRSLSIVKKSSEDKILKMTYTIWLTTMIWY
jgi:hypothetical protein